MREDFYYRIRVFEIVLPPLRERREDVPPLVNHFIAEGSKVHGHPIHDVAQDAMQRLMRYPWPGNIRELRNAIEHAFVTAEEGCLTVFDLPPEVRTSPSPLTRGSRSTLLNPDQLAERDQILEALHRAKGAKTKAAELLGYSRVTLWKKLQKFGIQELSSQIR